MSNLLLAIDDWEDGAAVTPPPGWSATGIDFAGTTVEWVWLGVAANAGDIVAAATATSSGITATATLDHSATRYLNVVVEGVVVQSFELVPGVATNVPLAVMVSGSTAIAVVLATTPTGILAATVDGIEVSLNFAAGVSNNCTCSDAGGRVYRTLLQLRQAIMRRLGWGNQLDNPPPGSAEMIDSFLYEAQYNLYYRFETLRLDRFFTWQLIPGVNLYGLGENIDDCDKRFNPDKLRWVGCIREGGLWTYLIAGIPPVLNSYPETCTYPIRYAIRQCIEVWPIPAENAGQLVLKAGAYLGPFVEDDDVASIDDSLVFALALADAKAHYRQPDADRYVQRAEVLLNGLAAGTHGTNRYIPGAAGLGLDPLYVQPVPEGGQFLPWPQNG